MRKRHPMEGKIFLGGEHQHYYRKLSPRQERLYPTSDAEVICCGGGISGFQEGHPFKERLRRTLKRMADICQGPTKEEIERFHECFLL